MIGSVKLFPITTMMLGTAALILCSAGCKPQAPDLERLKTVEANNEQLRTRIAEMQKRIREAGEPATDLDVQIADKRQAINDTLARKTELRRRETNLKLRYIELESRLKAFRADFAAMQNDIVNSTTAEP